MRSSAIFLLWQPILLIFSLALLQLNKLTPSLAYVLPLLMIFFSCICAWCCHQNLTHFLARQLSVICSLPRRGISLIALVPDGPVLSRSLSIQLLIVNSLSLGYVAVSFLLSAFSLVTNGDAQTYNISRLAVVILSKQIFISQTSIPTQAFHSFFHDYLYIPDLIYGNITGLGLISFIELVSLLYFSDYIVCRSHNLGRSLANTSIRSRLLARLIIISMPAIFYQANNVKNDLMFAPIMLALSIIVAHLASESSSENVDSGWNQNLSLITLLGLLSMYSGKGYGILFVFCFLFIAILINLRSSPVRSIGSACLHIINILKTIKSVPSRITVFFFALILLILLANLGFESNKSFYWAQSYSEFVQNHGPTGVDKIKAFPLTLSRLLLEAVINVPAFHSWSGGALPALFNKQYTLGGEFRFGGQITQDIAWPGIIFNVCFAWTIVKLFRRKKSSSLYDFMSSHDARNAWQEMSKLLFTSGLLISLAFAILLYWQPGFSRFFVSVSVLMIPFMAETVSKSLAVIIKNE